MAIIYSYPLVSTLDSSNLFPLTATNEEEDELYVANVTFSTLASEIIDEAFNGTDRYIPRFDGTSSLVNSTIYQDSNGNIGIGTQTPGTSKLKVNGSTNITGDVQVDTLTNNYIPVNNISGVLRDSNLFQESAANPGFGAIGLNTTKLASTFGEYPDFRVASRSLNDPGVLDLFRPDGDVQAGDRVGILQYSLDDDNQYTVAQIEVKTISQAGTGNSGGGKLCIKTSGNFSGSSPTERLCIDSTQADFSVPVNVTSTTQSSFAGQVTIPETPVANTDAASKAYVDGLVEGGLTFKDGFNSNTGGIDGGGNLFGAGPPPRVAIEVGDFYVVTVAGDFYGDASIPLTVGDSVICKTAASQGNSTSADWVIVQGDEGVVNLTSGNGVASTGNAITSNTTARGAVTVQSFAYAGGANVGHVPSGGDSTKFLRGDGTWIGVSAGNVSGSGTTNTLPVWSDGPNGVLSDSGISEIRNVNDDISNITISTSQSASPLSVDFGSGGTTIFKTGATEFIKLTNQVNGFYTSQFRFGARLTVDRDNSSQTPSLDVGDADHAYAAAWFRNGVVISNNPSGVQVDNTSMVIGAGNNDNVSGSDHCLIVGSGNQITDNSDQSVAFGQGNTITSSIDSLAVGNSNNIDSAQRVYALGYDNTISSGSSFVAGGQNTVGVGDTNIVIGFSNQSTGDSNFVIGNQLVSSDQEMVLGSRNNISEYPATDPQNGLAEVKFVVATGATTNVNSNALLITAGGKSGGNPTVPQVPRVIIPTVVNFNFADDTAAAAGGIPVGGLYHNAGVVRIRLT